MKDETQKLAREMARKCVLKIPPDVLEHPMPFPARLDYAAAVILRELNLAQLLADKERLEKVMEINHHAAKNLSDLATLLNERPETKRLIQTLALAINFHDRTAIDNAMKEGK